MFDIIYRNINTIIAILALLVSIYIYNNQKKRKYLDYEIINNTSLLEISKEIQKDVVILYKGTPIEQVHLIEINMKNNGDVSINKEEFKNPIKLHFGEGSEVLTYNVINKNPSNLMVICEPNIDDDNVIEVTPRLMNAKDKFTVKLLVSKMKKIIVEGRIEGVKKIRNESSLKVNYFRLLSPPFFMIFGLLFFYFEKYIWMDQTFLDILIDLFLIISGIILFVYSSVREGRKYILRFK